MTSTEPVDSSGDASSDSHVDQSLSTSNHSTSSASRQSVRSSPPLVSKETQRVFRSKLLVIFVLMVSAAVVGIAAFYAIKKEEERKAKDSVSGRLLIYFEYDSLISVLSSLTFHSVFST
jgi:hypothetical protein